MTDLFHREWFAPAAVFVIGTATILGAWGFQIVGGYLPCALCLQQRVPYYLGLPLVLAALLAALLGAKPSVPRSLLVIAGLIFAVNVFLAGYQAGAEWRLWEGPSTCGGASGAGEGSLLDQIRSIRIVSCTDPSWRFLLLSFAGWNAVVSAGLFVLSLWGAFRRMEPAGQPIHA